MSGNVTFGNAYRSAVRPRWESAVRHVNPDGGSSAPTTPSYGARLVAANSEYFSITDAAQTGLDFGTGDFSVGVWFYLDSFTATRGLLAKKSSAAGTDVGWNLAVNTTPRLHGRLCDGSAAPVSVIHGTTLSVDTLYLAIMTCDRDGNMGLSINAGAETTGSIAAQQLTVSNARAFVVGAHSDAPSNYFDGGLVCAFAANALLDATDRTALYNSGSPLLYSALGATQSAKMVSYWNLDEQSDGSAPVTRMDATASNNDLTDNNTCPSSAFPFTG